MITNRTFSQQENVKRLIVVDKKNFIFGFGINGAISSSKIIPSSSGTVGAPDNSNGGVNLAYTSLSPSFCGTGFMSILLIEDYLRLIVETGGWVGMTTVNYRQSQEIFEESLGRPFREGDNIRKADMYMLYTPIGLQLAPQRINNYKPFITVGMSHMYNLSSNEKYSGDNRDNVFRMKTNIFNYEVAVGVDFYFKYFKLSPTFKGIFGINNIIIPDNDPTPYTDPIDKMYFRAFMFSLIFNGSNG